MDGRWPHEISKETIRVLGVGVEGVPKSAINSVPIYGHSDYRKERLRI